MSSITGSTPIVGSWTPVWLGSTSQSGQVYSAQIGSYILLGGGFVRIAATVSLSTLGTITGQLRLGGLPFPSSSVDSSRATLHFGYFTNLGTSVINLTGVLPVGVSYFDIYMWLAAATTVSAAGQSTISATTDVIVSATYRAS